jgi:two-component system phosphate regulon sensor histidine kinase PhoR
LSLCAAWDTSSNPMFKNIESALMVCFIAVAVIVLGLFALFLRFSIAQTLPSGMSVTIYRSMSAALALTIAIAIIFSLVIVRSFSGPIERLAEITRKIAKGQFPQHIMRRSRFEVGDLEKNIEDMSMKLHEMFTGLSAERKRISAILSSMSEGVFAVDRWGRVILANPAIERTFGIIEFDILGKTVREAILNNEIADIVEDARRGLKGIVKEISISVPIGRSFIAEAAPIKDENGVFQGVVCVLRDMTDIRKLEGYRSEFVANVSHELKTPLTAIKSYVETLLGGAIDDKEHNREFLQKIEKHTVSLSALIDDILEISSLESKKEIPKFSKLDVSKIVSSAVDDILQKAQKKGVKIDSKCSDSSIFVLGIEDQLLRAVMNLLDNAVNYTPSGGSVSVSCLKENGSVKVSVSDSGIGIAEQHLPRIFERFYRVDKGRSRDVGGTGLGLAIVKHVMNIHSGSVSVESVEGVGSTFTLTFPVAAA